MNTKEQFEKLFANKLSTKEARVFLIDLYNKGETAEEIAIGASVMREHAIKLPLSKTLQEQAIDVVGTGGDKSGSFNISTTVSLLLASLGSIVAKHGNRSITSNSGSADALEVLGVNLNLAPEQQVKMLEETGFCFIFAMNHHPAMKHIMPIRKSIEHRTIFNILGPLTNPAGAKKYLLGVFSPEYIERMAKALIELEASRAFVVSSDDGMDEITLATTTQFAYIESGVVSQGVIDPQAYGFKLAPKEAILGGSATDNALITHNIFANKATDAQRDIVILNAGFALFADGKARDMKEAFEMARMGLESGKAKKHLEFIAKVSNGL
ncbi:MAG TPA: anthranilate phosphoribosyltransferase [Campylobacterales bacterium]|nr:anthranilate phosphoribosyltransferase [Campylobacterales bacterium]HIP41935.1 anthranilate phosphoribosyltransferase [Campylobacterales bacterium]